MFNSQNPQAYDVCPYNNSHRILKYRMAKHLVRCRKLHHGESAMTVCLFNANHSVAEAEKRYHMENCPDRFNLDKQVLIESDVDPSKFPIRNMEINDEESWDAENCASYQPDEYCKKTMVLRQTKVESATTRKNFRVGERERMQKLRDMGPSSTENEAPNKFRSAALANTTTNVEEESPFSIQDLQRIIQSGAPKPIIIDPKYEPVFVRSNGTDVEEPESSELAQPRENNELSQRCENNVLAQHCGNNGLAQPCDISDTSVASSSSPDPDSKQKEDEGFIKPKYRRKGGRGRGFVGMEKINRQNSGGDMNL
ncbi:hypothetical protein Trydic_g6958 [Trypoxylus dichotomus]